jgi:hypothetical protein
MESNMATSKSALYIRRSLSTPSFCCGSENIMQNPRWGADGYKRSPPAKSARAAVLFEHDSKNSSCRLLMHVEVADG